tara:strand:- start:147 stop:1712 length:1566 start_codon:yes stop_codon:yes gene_type:complete
MISIILSYKRKFFIVFLFFFSIIVNYYYASRGVFPQDSFLHFDSGYRILRGEAPFKDYWTVTAPLVDYLQAFFFYLFGLNWKSYVLHASLFNSILTLSTYFVLRKFKLSTNYSFIYSLFFCVLAYPSSGTPFVDHHSAFFSLLGIYSFLLAINNQRKLYWMIMPIFLGLAFLSKQVPAAYIILSVGFILFLYSINIREYSCIKYSLISSVFFVFCVLFFGKFQGIELSSFLDQYIFYPQAVGAERFKNLNFTYKGTIDHFKFIYLAIIPLFYVNFKKIFYKKNYIKHNDFYIFLSLFFLTFSLILSQQLTKNQTFIFFLIPILAAFSQISLIGIKLKYKKLIYLFIVLICLLTTIKYHLRFNEDRKFHELQNVNFDLLIDARKIDEKLSGLNWISFQYKNNPEKEIDLINQIQYYLKKDSRNKMVITNYSFFSIILNQNLFSPNRGFADDGTSHPLKGSEYAKKYEELMRYLIKKNKISVIYVVNSLDSRKIFHYVDLYKHCPQKIYIPKKLKSYDLENCS